MISQPSTYFIQQAMYAYLKMIGDNLQARYQNVHNKDNVIDPMFQSIVQSNRTLQKRLNLDFLSCLMSVVCRWLRNAGSSYLPVQQQPEKGRQEQCRGCSCLGNQAVSDF